MTLLTPFTRNLKQTATYWEPAGNDEYNRSHFKAPVTVPCRWQNKPVLFLGANNKENTSQTLIYCLITLKIEGFICLGDRTTYDSPLEVEDCKEIRQVLLSPDLKNTFNVVKVFL
mgnify:CR=1 FL=1